jgi:Holliday junction DNA helicase RuvA
MIATIEGVVAEKIGDTAIIELGGIGYEVMLPVEDWGNATIGKPAKFYVYEHIREDAHTLFGFSSVGAKQLFMQLLSVNGVGPKVAIQVMSAATLDRLQQALAAGDADLFKGVSGVGKKTAERIMLDLRGKVEATGAAGGSVAHGDAAYQALVGLGYSAQQAASAVAAVPADVIGEQERVKAALKQLS